MNTSIKRYLNPALGTLLLFVSVVAVAAIARQNLQVNTQSFEAKNETALTGSLKLEVESKARYFLGETPNVKIVRTNNSGSPQKVKEAEYEKFSLEIAGLLENDSQQKRTIVYDGSWDIPKETKPASAGGTHVFEELRKREPKFVQLSPGESTTLELDLSKTFGSYLGVSKYNLVVKSEDGQTVVREFEVYFDNEKSVAFLAEYLKSDDESQRNWAVSNLAKFARPKLITLLAELVKSGNEKQREFASGMLAQAKAGWFDDLKLRVEAKDRYVLGETPVLAISIVNGSSTIQRVKEAQYQKFSLELVGMVGNAKQETKTCMYDGGKQGTSKPSLKPHTQGHSQLVELSESESTTLSLNLSECFHSPFGVGKYELTVKSADPQQVFKDQQVVKKFEVYFEKTSRDNQ